MLYIHTYVYMYIFHAWSWLRVVCSFERKRSMICTVRNSVSVRSLNLRTPASPAWKVWCATRGAVTRSRQDVRVRVRQMPRR